MQRLNNTRFEEEAPQKGIILSYFSFVASYNRFLTFVLPEHY